MKKMPAQIFLILMLSVCGFTQNAVLENYVETGLENNLALRQKEFSLQKSMAALEEARGMFLPSIGINARYSRAGGGRTINIPVGDLVNPIYQTLNQILQQQRFPTGIPNETVPFLREREQETKVRLVQPLFKPAIYYNYQLKSDLTGLQQAEKETYMRQLVADIKTAYFRYLKTRQIVRLLESTQKLLQENLRVSRSLYENEKATREVVYRAEAELSDLQQQMAEAGKNQTLAAAHFNFLLNRPLETAIDTLSSPEVFQPLDTTLSAADSAALAKRPELTAMHMGIEAAANGIKLAKTGFLPGAVIALDYGIQGREYRFSDDADFWMASVVLEWNLFNGFQDKAKVAQRSLEKRRLQARVQEVKSQLRLEVRQAVQNLRVARKSVVAAERRLTSAGKSFEIIREKYRQGMTPQIEFIDARNSLTAAEINRIITTYDFHIHAAELERVTAAFPLETD